MGRAQQPVDVEEKLRDFLRQPQRRIGEKLPGERQLASTLGVGRAALRPALEQLEAENILERRPQSGTFLAAVPLPPVRGGRAVLVAPLQGTGEPGRGTEPSWLHRVISAFERTILPLGVRLQVMDQSPRASDPCSVTALSQDAVRAGAKAVVLLHPLGTRARIAHALAILHDQGVHPLIVSARTYPGLASQVYFDGGWGAYLATRHLLQQGHTRIGFAGSARGHEWVRERLAGYQGALEAADVMPEAGWVWLAEDGERLPAAGDGAAAFGAWQELPVKTRPTALVAANDVIALGVLDAAVRAGVRVPADLSLIGFDNDAGALRAGLTTVERPTEALGEAVARTTVERLAAGLEAATVTMRLRPVLIERATVAPGPT